MGVIAGVPQRTADLLRDLIILFPVGVKAVNRAAPGIKFPVDPPHFAVLIHYKSRPHIPGPGIVGINGKQTDIRPPDSRLACTGSAF